MKAELNIVMSLEELTSVICRRRTSMLVDKEREVPRNLVTQLCALAQWAPNHKRTWPWQFALVDGDGRARLGQVISAAMAVNGDPAEKVAKTLTKYLRTPASLVVGSAAGDSPLRTAENRDATAAGIQNLLLGATAAGLGTYWSSCPKGANDEVAALCGFENGTWISAIVYLGWATSLVECPQRPPVDLHLVH